MSASDWGKEFPSFAKLFNGRLSLKSGYIWSTEMTSKFSTFPWEAWRLKPGTHSQLSQHSFDNNHYSAYYREIWKPRRETKKSHAPREKMLLTKQLIVQNRQSQSVLVKKLFLKVPLLDWYCVCVLEKCFQKYCMECLFSTSALRQNLIIW